VTDVSYPEVGATGYGPLPPGYHHVRRSSVLGRGQAVFDAAVESLMTWEMHRRSGFTVEGSERVAVDEVAWLGIVAGRARVGFRCQVVEVTDSLRSKGFAYGTMRGHPESGEERFTVVWREDDVVELRVVAFSKPARWWSRAANPVNRLVQRWMTSRYLKTLRADG
jgi:uncharacterized protein (UPF0548 family)